MDIHPLLIVINDLFLLEKAKKKYKRNCISTESESEVTSYLSVMLHKKTILKNVCSEYLQGVVF